MQQVELKPIGRRVSCLGLGCARLDGRLGLRQSAELLETALELGITYFDVAAAYGTAEEALGRVIGNSKEVVIATKVGPPRPAYHAGRMRLRSIVKPVLDRMRGVKMLLRGAATRPAPDPSHRPRYDFSQQAIERSIETSLEFLRRDSVDVLLAHEPNRLDLVPEVSARFQSLVDRGLIRAFGVGVDAREDRWAPFGSIWQSGWPGERVASYAGDVAYIFHGVLRYAQTDRFGKTTVPAAELIRDARRLSPSSVLLVSASTPARLRELVRALQDASANGPGELRPR
jgi:aryl-alcohol dehydrogenase-like predicted oxidoreductase